MNNIKNDSLQAEMLLQNQSKKLLEQAKSYGYSYLDGVYDRNVFPDRETLQKLDVFDEPLPKKPGNSQEILQLLHDYGSPATTAQIGGRYFGFVSGSTVPTALAAKWLVDVWDQNSAAYLSSPIVSKLETVCENWVVDLLGLPAGTAAGFVSGSSIATLCGLAAGRNELLRRSGWDVNSDGLFGAPNIRVVLGEQAHATVYKAIGLLGLGRARVELVPVDSQGCMLADKMPKLDSHCLVIAQAGNVSSGAFDPFDAICDLAQSAGAWVHVDGAFGLWAAASCNQKSLTRGIEKADSWSVDAHKTLNAPYDSGIVLCRQRETLLAALQTNASYLAASEKRDGMDYTPEMSRRARAVELWATLKFFGKDGVQELVDRLCLHAQEFARQLSDKGFRILNDVVFNQVLVACDTPELTKATLETIQASGECWCGGAVWRGEPVIRISVCSWATTSFDIERCAAAFESARESCEKNAAL